MEEEGEGEGEGCVLTRLSTSSSAESHRQYYNENSPKQHAPIPLATPQRAKPRATTRINMHICIVPELVKSLDTTCS